MTENGWPACGPDMLDRSVIPGTNIVLPLQRGIPSRILKAAAADIHAYVESLYNVGGGAVGGGDEGGWTPTNSVPTSNHLGGTAMDLNWSRHTFQVSWAGWDSNERRGLEELFGTKANPTGWYEGMVFFAQYWNSPIDPMHFQMGYNTYNNLAKCNDFLRRKIRDDGFSTFRRGGSGSSTPPVVVQPFVWAELGHEGEHVLNLQRFFNDNYTGYAATPLDEDGIFGPQTESAVREFQSRSGIDSDGIVGPITLEFLKTAGFTPEGEVVVTPTPWPQSATDRELLEYMAEQFGPGHPSWASKGMTLRDKVWSLGAAPKAAPRKKRATDA